MESAEAQLREIQLALKYCGLDYHEILEDYREHLKELRKRANIGKHFDSYPKPERRKSA